MKRIIYTRPDGGLTVCVPAEGCRLAKWVVLPSGDVLVGVLTGVSVLPEEMVAEALGRIELIVGKTVVPRPVDRFVRNWPVEGAVAEWAETESEWLARVAAKSVPKDATDVQVVDESAIPADRTFRNAWKAGTGKVEHDMAKCREIQKSRLREIRAPKLAALDVEFMRALEAGDNAKCAEIAAQKQALRDVTKDPAITAAKTVEELKAAIPAVLRA